MSNEPNLMNPDTQINRRNFLGMMSAAGAALAIGGAGPALAAVEEKPRSAPIHFFSKPLDAFEMDFIADTLRGAGVDGLDLTVRPGGKVNPEHADVELPKIASALSNHKLSLKMMVTAISGPASPFAEKVLKAASDAGIRHYRMGYFDFDAQTGMRESLEKHRATLRQLAELNRKFGIQAGYQNHAGTRVGAPVWDLVELLRDIPKEQVSVQYDVRHGVAEGTASWVLGMRAVQRLIGSLVIKDCRIGFTDKRVRIENVPLGEGIIDFDAWCRMVKEMNIQAPISLHIEYPLLARGEEALTLLEKQNVITSRLKHDVDFVRALLSKHQIVMNA